MEILLIQETDWFLKGPGPQHHLCERLASKNGNNLIVFDYDIDKIEKITSKIIKKKIFKDAYRTIAKSNVKVIRSLCLRIPYVNRISSLIMNFFNIGNYIRKNRPSIIINLSITNGLIAYFYSRLYHIPFIFHYVDILHELVPIASIRRFARVMARFLLSNSDLIFVLNETHKNFVINEIKNKTSVKILPNGISLENTKVDSIKLQNLRKKHNIGENDTVLLFMGRLYEFAGLLDIVKFYNKDIMNKKLNLKFLILGIGEIYSQLKKYIEDNGIDWVILTGLVPFNTLANYLELGDLCLQSFKKNNITKEITPIKLLEYMAMKKPVLSTKLPGIYKQFGENNGIIFTYDQSTMIKKIRELINRKDYLKQVG
ncbi:MAG: glycosyltransferase, partial [Promethearchaeota archaeon]